MRGEPDNPMRLRVTPLDWECAKARFWQPLRP
jgi:hypothetical protein